MQHGKYLRTLLKPAIAFTLN